jgi:hypothetical protein
VKPVLLVLSLLLATACAGAKPPSADQSQRPFPDFGGRTVMVLPTQSATPLIAAPANVDTTRRVVTLTADQLAALDAEIAFWLAESAGRVKWVPSAAVEKAVRANAALNVSVRDLPVRDFLRSRVESIGDPLYGELRSVGLLADARVALLPIGAIWIPETGGGGRIHLAVALIDTIGGRVFWQGVLAGATAAQLDAAAIASTAQALANQIR